MLDRRRHLLVSGQRADFSKNRFFGDLMKTTNLLFLQLLLTFF
jgi:hypothetical protein